MDSKLSFEDSFFLAFGSIGQRRLHDRTVELEDRRVEKASLFPLFDRAGDVKALLLTSRSSAEIFVAEWQPDLVERRWFRPIRLRMRRDDFRAGVDGLELDALWHFDPWWELGSDRYSENPAAEPLKATNLPGYDDSVTRVWFSPDLSRVTWVGSGRGESMRVRRHSSRELRAADESRQSTPRAPGGRENRSGWKLSPFWS